MKIYFRRITMPVLMMAGLYAAGQQEKTEAVFLEEGRQKMAARKFKEAAEIYTSCIGLFPGSAACYQGRGAAGFYLKNYAAAFEDFTHAIELDSVSGEAYFIRGDYYHRYNVFDSAIADMTKTAELMPANEKVFAKRGAAYNGKASISLTGRDNWFDSALADFNRALELNPSCTECYGGKGFAYRQKKNSAKAIENYLQVIKLNEKDYITCSLVGDLYSDQDKPDEAINYYSLAETRNPRLLSDNKFREKFALLYQRRAMMHCRNGNKEKAAEDEKKAITLGGVVANACK